MTHVPARPDDPRGAAREAPEELSCASDGDCPTGDLCRGTELGGVCRCFDTCASDADCAPNEACICASHSSPPSGPSWYFGTFDEYRPAECKTNSDCPSGECGLSFGDCRVAEGLYCRTPDDACRTDADCPSSESWQCSYALDERRWTCQPEGWCE